MFVIHIVCVTTCTVVPFGSPVPHTAAQRNTLNTFIDKISRYAKQTCYRLVIRYAQFSVTQQTP